MTSIASPYRPGIKHYAQSDRPELIELVPESARTVLDVGCATGHFGARLRERRREIEVHGLEPNADAAAEAASLLTSVTLGVYPDEAPPGPFDCIVFADVLEHMVDPWAALRAARMQLTAEGCIVASIPNIRHIDIALDLLIRGRFDYTDAGILDRTHLRFFTLRSVDDLLTSTGYHREVLVRFEGTSQWRPSAIIGKMGRFTRDLRTVQYGLRAVPIKP